MAGYIPRWLTHPKTVTHPSTLAIRPAKFCVGIWNANGLLRKKSKLFKIFRDYCFLFATHCTLISDTVWFLSRYKFVTCILATYLCVYIRLIDSIDDMKRVIMDSAQFLLTSDKSRYSYSDAGSIFDMV